MGILRQHMAHDVQAKLQRHRASRLRALQGLVRHLVRPSATNGVIEVEQACRLLSPADPGSELSVLCHPSAIHHDGQARWDRESHLLAAGRQLAVLSDAGKIDDTRQGAAPLARAARKLGERYARLLERIVVPKGPELGCVTGAMLRSVAPMPLLENSQLAPTTPQTRSTGQLSCYRQHVLPTVE